MGTIGTERKALKIIPEMPLKITPEVQRIGQKMRPTRALNAMKYRSETFSETQSRKTSYPRT